MNEQLRQAQQDVEASRLQVEEAIDHLVLRFRDGTNQVRDVVDQIKAPFQLIRDNPLASIAIFITGGFLIGALIRSSRAGRSGQLRSVPDPEVSDPIRPYAPGSIPVSSLEVK